MCSRLVCWKFWLAGRRCAALPIVLYCTCCTWRCSLQMWKLPHSLQRNHNVYTIFNRKYSNLQSHFVTLTKENSCKFEPSGFTSENISSVQSWTNREVSSHVYLFCVQGFIKQLLVALAWKGVAARHNSICFMFVCMCCI